MYVATFRLILMKCSFLAIRLVYESSKYELNNSKLGAHLIKLKKGGSEKSEIVRRYSYFVQVRLAPCNYTDALITT